MRLWSYAWLIAPATILAFGPAFGKCKFNMGKDWRIVGIAGTVKAVCRNSSCGGAQVYVYLTNFKKNNAYGAGSLASMKHNGKSTSAPIKNWAGYHSEFPVDGRYQVHEMYYKGDPVGSEKISLQSIASKSKIARANFRHAKSTLVCR